MTDVLTEVGVVVLYLVMVRICSLPAEEEG